MRAFLLSAAAAIGLAGPALANERFEAILAGQAILPAFTMALPPADAPRDALVSGKFAAPGRRSACATPAWPCHTLRISWGWEPA